MNELIDVLAVMDRIGVRLFESRDLRAITDSGELHRVRSAVAELIEAHKELMAGYESRCGDWENADFNACYRRAAAALASVQGSAA